MAHQDWDKYVTDAFQRNAARQGGELQWPGDEWGDPESWQRTFKTLFEPAEVGSWVNAVEIGQGSGKYTKMVLDAAPQSKIVAFDSSAEYLKVCAERLADDVAAGRLFLEHLPRQRSDEMISALEAKGLAGSLDGFFSIDAMVHVDLQYLITYLLTSAVALRQGGHLVLTLGDASTDHGFEYLVSSASRFYGVHENPLGKFEWISAAIIESILERLGYEIVVCDNPPDGEGRDIYLVAKLVDREPGYKLSWALTPAVASGETSQGEDGEWQLSWNSVGADSYEVEFSLNEFATLLESSKSNDAFCEVPDTVAAYAAQGQRVAWRVLVATPVRRIVVAGGEFLDGSR